MMLTLDGSVLYYKSLRHMTGNVLSVLLTIDRYDAHPELSQQPAVVVPVAASGTGQAMCCQCFSPLIGMMLTLECHHHLWFLL